MPQAALITAASAAISGQVVGTALLQFGASYLLGQVAQQLWGAKEQDTRLPGTQLSNQNPAASVHTVYGEMVKSGTIFFRASSGDQDEHLHVCYVLAGHTCEEIGEAYFDGVPESELLHTNTKQISSVYWTGRYHGGDGDDFPIDVALSVTLSGQTFSSDSAGDLAEQINAVDFPFEATGEGSRGDMRAELILTALEDTQDIFTVKAGRGSFDTRVVVGDNDADNDAFQIWRHTGELDQPADAELMSRFADGRKARVVVKWADNLVSLNLTVNLQQVTGDADDILDFIENSPALTGITAERQGSDDDTNAVEILLEHSVEGQAIEVSSNNSQFSFEHLQSPAPVWTAAHQGKGVAYVHVRYARRSEVWGNRMPDATFRVKGKRLFDPRDNSTKFTDNWALVMRDALLTFYQIPEDRPVAEEIAIAATVSDERVLLDDAGNTQARYTVNGVVSDAEEPGDVLVSLQQHGGLMARRLGRPTLVPHVPQPIQAAITDTYSEIFGRPDVQLGHPRRELFNTVLPSFVGEATGWLESRAPDVTSPFYLAQDDGEELKRKSTYRFANDEMRAQRLAKIDLEQHRQQQTTSVFVGRHRLDCAAGTVVPITLDTMGWNAKLFQVVTAIEYGPNHEQLSTSGIAATGGINLELREYAPEAFDWNKGEATKRDYARNTTLSPTRFVRMPAQLDVTTTPAWFVDHTNNMQLAMAYVDWADPLETSVERYELQWRQGEEDIWRDGSDVRTTQSVIGPISDAADIYVRVRAVGLHGKRSRWASVGPVPVNSVNSITGGDGSINISRQSTAPLEPDLNDLWYQTNPADKVIAQWYWNSAKWVDIKDSEVASAIANATTARALVDGKATAYFKPSTEPPESPAEDDLWFQVDTQKTLIWRTDKWDLQSSQEWDDMFGATKPDDLASAEGTYMIDTTFSKLRAGYETWELVNDTALIDAGLDGSAVRLQYGSQTDPMPSMVSKIPIVVPGNRYMTCRARIRARFPLNFMLVAVNDDGTLTNILQRGVLPVSYGDSTEWKTISVNLAIDLAGYRRFVFQLYGQVQSYYTNVTWDLDSLEISPQQRVPTKPYDNAWENTLRNSGELKPFGWPQLQQQYLAENQAYALEALRPTLKTVVAESSVHLKIRYRVYQHTTTGTVNTTIYPTITARVEGKKPDGTWITAGETGASIVESTPGIRLSASIESSFDFQLHADLAEDCELRLVFVSDTICAIKVSEFSGYFWT